MKRYLKILIVLSLLAMSALAVTASEVKTSSLEDKKKEESAEVKVIYLTFDDGPSEYTETLLDLLDAHGMKATFFMLEAEMKRYPEVVMRMVEEGHAVGVHGVSHEKNVFYSGTLTPLKEMEQANATLESITGERTFLARTPYGSSPYLTQKQEGELVSHQYILWDWNIDSRDWCYRNASKTFYATIKMIEKCQKEPKVVLMHDMKQSVETVKMMTSWMEGKNYTSKAITSELEPVKLYRKK